MNRRDFLRTSAVFGSAALTHHRFPYEAFASPTPKHATDLVTLGRTGIKVSRLAQGTGTNGVERSSNQIRGLGFQGVADLLRTGVDNGVTFWDVADQYGSHPHVRQALKAVDRDKVVIMTKTRASTEAEMRADLDRFRQEMGTERIDIVLLHCMMDDRLASEEGGGDGRPVRGQGEGDDPGPRRVLPHPGRPADRGRDRLGRSGPRSLQRGRRRHGRSAAAGAEGARGHEGEGQGDHRHEDPGRGRSSATTWTRRSRWRSGPRPSTRSPSAPRARRSSWLSSGRSPRPVSGPRALG